MSSLASFACYMENGDEDVGKIETKGMLCKVFWARESEVGRR